MVWSGRLMVFASLRGATPAGAVSAQLCALGPGVAAAAGAADGG